MIEILKIYPYDLCAIELDTFDEHTNTSPLSSGFLDVPLIESVNFC
jgi:hypothetical protein